jgi:hypothetical protein
MYLVDTQARFNPRCYRVGPTTGPAARPAPVVSDVGLTSLCACTGTGISLPGSAEKREKDPKKANQRYFPRERATVYVLWNEGKSDTRHDAHVNDEE